MSPEVITSTIIAVTKYAVIAYGIYVGGKVLIHYISLQCDPLFPSKESRTEMLIDEARKLGLELTPKEPS